MDHFENQSTCSQVIVINVVLCSNDCFLISASGLYPMPVVLGVDPLKLMHITNLG